MRHRLSAALAALLALPALATPAHAAPTATVPVWEGLERQEWSLRTPGGDAVAAQVLVVTEPGGLRLRPVLAQQRVPGLETVPDMGRRLLPSGGVAGVNGGFWLSQPLGEPNSYLAIDGALVSEAETQGPVMRGTFALRAGGQPLVDRIDTALRVEAEGSPLPIDGVNRIDRGDPNADPPDIVYAYTPHYGADVRVATEGQPGARGNATAVVLHGAVLPASGRASAARAEPARTVPTGDSVAIPPDGVVLLAYGSRRQELVDAVPDGATVTLETVVTTLDRDRSALWADVTDGLAAGPLILRGREITAPDSCAPEGFEPWSHCEVRAPRSAIGHTADGRIVMVGVDGRQPGHSAGMTMGELARFVRDLGAVDAIALDGGGSTTVVVDGIATNRPSDGRPRIVANGLFLFHDQTMPGTVRLAGAGREQTAAEIALAAYPAGAEEVVLAAGGDFPDALAGGPLAAALGAPLLLTARDTLSPDAARALADLGARRVTLLGGDAAIDEAVHARLEADGYEVRRLAGRDRIETAVAVAAAVGAADTVFLAWAGGFADALSAAATAGLLGSPVLLTGSESLAPAAADALRATAPAEVVLVGGSRVLGDAVEAQVRAMAPQAQVRRLSGATRFGTSRAVNEWAEQHVDGLDDAGLVVAQGEVFPDALAGGPFAAARRQLLAIVPAMDVTRDADAAAYLTSRRARGLDEVVLLGGPAVLGSYQQLQLHRLTE